VVGAGRGRRGRLKRRRVRGRWSARQFAAFGWVGRGCGRGRRWSKWETVAGKGEEGETGMVSSPNASAVSRGRARTPRWRGGASGGPAAAKRSKIGWVSGPIVWARRPK
jgi:hypothetical protein